MSNSFDLTDRAAVVTGGGGVLGAAMAGALADAGARVVLLGRTAESLDTAAAVIRKSGGTVITQSADVLDEDACTRASQAVREAFGSVDILVNAAGGASKAATTDVEQILPSVRSSAGDGPSGSERTILDVGLDAFRAIGDLNFLGTFIPIRAFLPAMLDAGRGSIINIASMGASWPLTKSPAYSAGKAAVVNLTKWLAVHLAKTGVRVNALSPGFFLTKQNRFLLFEETTGEMTPRGQKILDGTPMARFGEPEELSGALLWLAADASSFVTGADVPVDGGFGAYGGV